MQRLIFLKHFHLRWTNRSITDCTQVIDEFEAKKGRIETADEKAIRHSKKRKFEHELKPTKFRKPAEHEQVHMID